MDKIKRILGLDVGDKRIGVAVSDPLCFFATEAGLIVRKKDEDAIKEILSYLEKFETDTIVVGLPYNMDGTTGFQAQKTIDFIQPLKETCNIIYRDERLTSFEAEEILKKEKKKYTKDKGLVDIKSACIILQEYLGEIKK